MIGLRLGLSSSKGLLKNAETNLPQAPSNFLASAGDRVINLIWDTVEGATYSIYRNTKDSSETASLLEGEESSQSFVDSNILAGSVYFYWVKAKVDEIESTFSPPSFSRAFVTVQASSNVTLETPNEDLTWGTVFFAQNELPSDITVVNGDLTGIYDSTTNSWFDTNTFDDITNNSFSGTFTLYNTTENEITFWNTDP